MRTWFAALLATFLPLVAWSAEGLSGTWRLDLAASDSLQPLLVAQGVPGWKRKIADKLSVTQQIEDTGDSVKVNLSSSLHTDEQLLTLDGVEREQAGQEGRTAMVRHERAEDGTVITWSKLTTADAKPALLVVRRVLADDGATMVQRLELSVDGGEAVVMKRVFRRQAQGG